MSYRSTILHISDLHKLDTAHYSNLLFSLKKDCRQYSEKEGIQRPTFIVITGDIINGGSETEISNQYSQAALFLKDLCHEFLNDDKERMFIVPGNHDVDWNVTRDSMSPVNLEGADENVVEGFVVSARYADETPYRLNNRNLRIFQIVDGVRYNEKFKAFSKFYNEFYEGKRSFSLTPEEQYFVYSFNQYKVTFVGLNSAYAIDHCRDNGKILPDCVANASDEIERASALGHVVIALWHHNISGLPLSSDYLDNRVLSVLIQNKVQIGLHGHQHKGEIVREVRNIIDEECMYIISAGSLYGSHSEIPTGANRQYNVVELDVDPFRGKGCLTVHSRECIDSVSYDIPQWSAGKIGRTERSWTQEFSTRKCNSLKEINNILMEYEQDRNLERTKMELCSIGMNNVEVRKVLLGLLTKANDDAGICECFICPQNDNEVRELVLAASHLTDIQIKKQVIEIDAVQHSQDTIVKDLRKKILTELTFLYGI